MKTRALNGQEKALLLHCLREHAPNLVGEIDRLDQVDVDKINEMREAVGDELMVRGINNEDSGLNKYGLELQDLIARLADLYIWPKELEK